MGCSSTKEKTTNSSLVLSPQSLRTIPESSIKDHQSENLNRIPKKTIWEARVIIENENNKQPISTKNVLKQRIHRLKQISYLRLSLDNGIDTQLREVQRLRKSLRSIKSLDKLSLKCPSFFDSDSFLRPLFRELKKNAKSLKIFHLKLDWATAKEMKILCSLLSNLRYTPSFVLNFRPNNAASEGLGPTLKHLTSLTTLHLTIKSSVHLDAKGITNCLSSLRLLHSLSNLSLKFSFCEGLDDQALQSLSSGLKCLSALSTLSFKLRVTRTVSNQGIANFLMSLGCLIWISGLDLRLYDCAKINDTVMASLWSVLKQKLTSLSSLALVLNLHQYNTGDQTITQLSRCFSDLPLLSSFSLYGYRWTCDKDIEILILALQQLKSLSSLHIDFLHCYSVDDGIQIFSKHLIKLSNLSSLTISFNLWEASNEGIDKIFKALSYLTLLTTFSLKFEGPTSVMSGVTEGLYVALKYLNLLSDLELEFEFLLQFDRHRLDEFTSHLKRANPSLRLIKIQGYKEDDGYLSKGKKYYFYL